MLRRSLFSTVLRQLTQARGFASTYRAAQSFQADDSLSEEQVPYCYLCLSKMLPENTPMLWAPEVLFAPSAVHLPPPDKHDNDASDSQSFSLRCRCACAASLQL